MYVKNSLTGARTRILGLEDLHSIQLSYEAEFPYRGSNPGHPGESGVS